DPERLPRTASPNAAEPADRAAWQRLAPEVRDGVTRVFVNAGKAIEAYVRTIRHGPSRFDRYAAAVLRGREDPAAVLTPSEARGLRLFLGRAGCVGCHNGPLFTNGEFHALGVPDVPEVGHDPGRARGIRLVQADEFNCLSRWSDAPRSACGELEFLRYDPARQDGAFKTPSLRNVAGRPPYMHAGQFATLREVLEFYRKRSGEPGAPPELLHGDLTDRDLADLEAFLHTLSGEVSSL
ncbi:MAG: cytochrome-c peroxidase, partial [Candidatus Dadabacteria bacterium]